MLVGYWVPQGSDTHWREADLGGLSFASACWALRCTPQVQVNGTHESAVAAVSQGGHHQPHAVAQVLIPILHLSVHHAHRDRECLWVIVQILYTSCFGLLTSYAEVNNAVVMQMWYISTTAVMKRNMAYLAIRAQSGLHKILLHALRVGACVVGRCLRRGVVQALWVFAGCGISIGHTRSHAPPSTS